MEKIKKFIKQKSAIRKIIVFTGLLSAFWANFIIFDLITGKPFTFAKAQKAIGVTMTVAPTNPVEKTEKIETKKSENPPTDFKSSEYRVISTIPDTSENKNETIPEQAIVKKPVVTFRGRAIYSDSEVFLAISSDKIFTSVMSDSQEKWSWTNWGYPLENGEHSIEVSNISPFELSGKRDILTQKYFFAVETSGNDSGMEELPLENVPIAKEGGAELKDRLTDKNSNGVYSFNVSLLNKKEYNPGDEIYLEMIFNPLGNISKNDAKIRYEIYSYNQDSLKETLVYNFEDSVNLALNKDFLKKIKLKDTVQDGNYFIKVLVEIGDDKYIQSTRFTIGPKILVQIGSTKIDEEKFNIAVAWNIILIVGFAIILLILIIFEYKKMSVCNLVDENELRARHYFSN